MPTYAFSIGSPLPFSWPSGKLLRARFFDAAAGTVTDLALVEVTPGEYAGTTQAVSTSSSFTVVIRQVDTQDAAGFDASTATNRQAFADDYTPASSFTTGTGGGSVLGQTTFRLGIYNGSGTKFDPTGLTGVTMPNGVVVRGTSTVVVAANTAMERTGTGTWTGPTITDAASGLVYEWTARLTFADGSAIDDDRVTEGSTAGTATTLTTRALIEAAGGVVNMDVAADANADAVDAEITAQFDRVVSEAQDAARESADDAGALSLWPLATTDAQYAALVRAATDFAVARLQQLRPEPVTPPKEPVGITGERVAREKMLDIWETILLRADTATASAPVAEAVTYYPPGCGYGRLTTYGPICG